MRHNRENEVGAFVGDAFGIGEGHREGTLSIQLGRQGRMPKRMWLEQVRALRFTGEKKEENNKVYKFSVCSSPQLNRFIYQ